MARGSNTYVLCFEHLGGLVPLLIGRQVNRFLPQFQIFLYQQEHEIPEFSLVLNFFIFCPLSARLGTGIVYGAFDVT
uniref:Uncharacterized protein n=1 Tax=Caenorhabditis japonica TaxID=281687 RepID=A0A8R1ICQ2_CAEJA